MASPAEFEADFAVVFPDAAAAKVRPPVPIHLEEPLTATELARCNANRGWQISGSPAVDRLELVWCGRSVKVNG
jgi:hypothetical protein